MILLNIVGFCEVRWARGVRRDVVSATNTFQCIFTNVLVCSRLPADLRVFSGRAEFYCAVVFVD